MNQGALCALTLILGITAGLLIAVATYATELRRISRFLAGRDPQSNARLTLNATAPGLTELASSINNELERGTKARIGIQRHQQEFQRDLSALSHDIRTPLMGAKGYLQLASNETDPAVRAQRLDAAIDRIDATAALLDQLFSYTKASDPDLKLVCEHLELKPIVERILLGHYPEFEACCWEPALHCDGVVTLMADREALTRLLENLVSNALRYGSGAPVITCGRGTALLSISNPVAHPEAIDASRLFERFYQADSSRGQGGAGLGLATSAKLANAMGLKLTAHLDGNALVIELSK